MSYEEPEGKLSIQDFLDFLDMEGSLYGLAYYGVDLNEYDFRDIHLTNLMIQWKSIADAFRRAEQNTMNYIRTTYKDVRI